MATSPFHIYEYHSLKSWIRKSYRSCQERTIFFLIISVDIFVDFIDCDTNARVLEWITIPFSRGYSQPRDQTPVSCIAGRFFTIWTTREAPNISFRTSICTSRQRLGTGAFFHNTDTWTNISSSNKMQRNYQGLKATGCMHSWGKLWTIRYKNIPKSQLPLLKSWEQKQGTVHARYTQHHRRDGQTT